NGHPTLLQQHRQRMLRSAAELGLSIDAADFPDHPAVTALILAEQSAQAGASTDHRLRITLSGGRTHRKRPAAQIRMSAGPLPPPFPNSGAVIKGSIQVADDDPLARHKTLNYWRKRIAHEEAIGAGCDEVLCMTFSGMMCEATRSNIFVIF